MRYQMNDDEKTMYRILRDNPTCRNSNWEAVREFYWQRYGINLPKLQGVQTVWTVERMIRTLKAQFPEELTDQGERQIKADMEEAFREQSLENKPLIPEPVSKKKPEKYEQLGIGLLGYQNYR